MHAGETKNLQVLLSALRARFIALVISFQPTVTLTTCDEQEGEIRQLAVAVFSGYVKHATKSAMSC